MGCVGRLRGWGCKGLEAGLSSAKNWKHRESRMLGKAILNILWKFSRILTQRSVRKSGVWNNNEWVKLWRHHQSCVDLGHLILSGTLKEKVELKTISFHPILSSWGPWRSRRRGEVASIWEGYKKSVQLTDIWLPLKIPFCVKRTKKASYPPFPVLNSHQHLSVRAQREGTEIYFSCCLFGTSWGISKDKLHEV